LPSEAYGAGVPVAGQFSGQLSNSGELLRVLAANGDVIASVTYGDSAPWPSAADGDGPSLTLIHPAAGVDYSAPENWRASMNAGGSPGTADAQNFTGANPNADADGDGLTAFAEHALGTSDTDARSGRGAVTAVAGAGTIDAVFTHLIAADDALLTPELSTDLVTWQSGPGVFTLISDIPQGGGIAIATYRAALPANTAHAFVRVRVNAR